MSIKLPGILTRAKKQERPIAPELRSFQRKELRQIRSQRIDRHWYPEGDAYTYSPAYPQILKENREQRRSQGHPNRQIPNRFPSGVRFIRVSRGHEIQITCQYEGRQAVGTCGPAEMEIAVLENELVDTVLQQRAQRYVVAPPDRLRFTRYSAIINTGDVSVGSANRTTE